MSATPAHELDKIFAVCRSFLTESAWRKLVAACGSPPEPARFVEVAAQKSNTPRRPGFIADLARLEFARFNAAAVRPAPLPAEDRFELNPSLDVVQLSWALVHLFSPGRSGSPAGRPRRAQQWALVWQDAVSGETRVEAAGPDDLLAIKIVVDETPLESAAADASAVRMIQGALLRAADKGLLVAPRPHLRRDPSLFSKEVPLSETMLTADTFTLQWHITHACDLHCRHCYDRSKRTQPTFAQALTVLDDLESFCRQRFIRGHVCLSGGNPFLYPRFAEVYDAAAQRGFSLSILGNPVADHRLRELVEIQKPTYFQVSLEGLEKHNDSMRGEGHFQRVLDFLDVLRQYRISSAVMLTLTRDNIDQVLPLARLLRDRADYFTFNRLSPVGEGAQLALPSTHAYAVFLKQYIEASRCNPILGFKDNLINIVLHSRGEELFEGCTGFGCGAAFNFLVVLPDGETHACRKFPSPVGNVFEQGLAAIYDSVRARHYRAGSSACRGCAIRHACGGCLAITSGLGRRTFEDRDPYCFMKKHPRAGSPGKEQGDAHEGR